MGDARGLTSGVPRRPHLATWPAGPPYQADWHLHGRAAGLPATAPCSNSGPTRWGFHDDLSCRKGTRDCVTGSAARHPRALLPFRRPTMTDEIPIRSCRR